MIDLNAVLLENYLLNLNKFWIKQQYCKQINTGKHIKFTIKWDEEL